jgi:hypothetical protein
MTTGIHQAAKFAMRNKSEIDFATKCGCYYCLAVFEPKEINEWTDGGETALCPRCSIDSVIADVTGIALTEENLRKAHDYWF